MFLVALSIVVLALVALLVALFLSPNLRRQHPLLRVGARLFASNEILHIANRFKSFLISERFHVLDSYLGQNALLRLVAPSLLFLALGLLVIGPILVGPKLGLVLGLLIGLAYVSRLILHCYLVFRDSLLAQIDRVLLSIRNNLSAGMTLDYAVTDVAIVSHDEPIASDLRGFLQRAEVNFLESFPSWLDTLRHKFHLRSLAKSSQLLGLELHYTNNQEEAFLDAVNSVHNSLSTNKKQRSTLTITLFTLDFIVLAFFAVLFYVIPSFTLSSDLSWWNSADRPWVIFQSGLVIWGAYLLTIAVALGRQE
jgi:hypothetical protein